MQSDYLQPEFYRFSQDSIYLASKASQLFSTYFSTYSCDQIKILDLAAGCGVVGLEFIQKIKCQRELEKIVSLDFLEAQEAFIPFLAKNIDWVRSHFKNNIKMSILHQSFQTFSDERYNFVISNPPYFEEDSGLLPFEMKRRMARFFHDSSFAEYLYSLGRILLPGGIAVFLNCKEKVRLTVLHSTPWLEVLSVDESQVGANLFVVQALC